MPNNTEIIARETGVDAENYRIRQLQFSTLQRIAPVVAGSPFPSSGILGPGQYKGARLTGTVRVSGLGWPTVAGEVELLGNATITGVVFEQPVRVRAAARAQFNGCIALAGVYVDSGGKVAWTGGRFDGNGAILNSGGAGNAVVVGAVKTSGVAHANVTTFGEV